MKPLELVKYPDPRLRASCQPVTAFNARLQDLAEGMLQLMKQSQGVGLAGPQVGVLQRIFVCNPTGEPEDDLVVVNPQLSELAGSVQDDEGCLSIPEVTVPVRRAKSCVLEAVDACGQPFRMMGADLLARIWQHENDHLYGKLILDYMDEASRMSNRRAVKHLEETYSGRRKRA